MKSLGNTLLLVVSAIGALLFLLNMFLVDKTNSDSVIATITIIFSVILLLGVFGLFFFFKFKDVQVHPEHLQEMKIVLGVVLGIMLLSVVLSFISGGTSDMVTGAGNVYAGAFKNLVITTGVWMLVLMPLVAVALWIKDAIVKK
ncbi:MAG: hypothetical protein H6604_09300 [Flavobacteriales bacterium]|nr:hypothetical protein [Flavobacteriales bacterium]